jgi:hypothetical protein
MSKILIIHPYDKTTTFLEGIYEPLIDEIGDEISVLNIETNANSHRLALLEMVKENYETIIFMGHGRSHTLFGARGDDYDDELEISEDEQINNPLFFYEDKFIHHYNIGKFSGKKVFCLSCRSVDKIGFWAIHEGGAKALIGFGSIPTDEVDYRENDDVTANELDDMHLFRSLLNEIVLSSLLIALKNNSTFTQLALLLKINVHKQIYSLFKQPSKENNKRRIANNLVSFKNEMRIFGDSSVKMMD